MSTKFAGEAAYQDPFEHTPTFLARRVFDDKVESIRQAMIDAIRLEMQKSSLPFDEEVFLRECQVNFEQLSIDALLWGAQAFPYCTELENQE